MQTVWNTNFYKRKYKDLYIIPNFIKLNNTYTDSEINDLYTA